MPEIDIVDSTWIGADPATVAAAVGDPANWWRWWPALELSVRERRGLQGMRWTVRKGPGETAGDMEIWLQKEFDGVVLHYFLQLDSTGPRPLGPRRGQHVAIEYRRLAKRAFWALGDELDTRRVSRMTAPR